MAQRKRKKVSRMSVEQVEAELNELKEKHKGSSRYAQLLARWEELVGAPWLAMQ